MGKVFKRSFREFNTNIHTVRFDPKSFRLTLTEGVRGVKQNLTNIEHNWMKNNGFDRIAGINAQFFGAQTVGLQFVDSGFLMRRNAIDDQFLELIFQNNELIIDNIVAEDINAKYPNANWVAGVGFQLVGDGKINTRYGNRFSHFTSKHPRTAIGQKENGEIIMLATDGRVSGSSGLTGNELARVMLNLGCKTAISMDGGGSSQINLTVNDRYQHINTLEGNWQRPITSALVLYGKEWELVDEDKTQPTPQPTQPIGNLNIPNPSGHFTVIYSHLDEIYVKQGDQTTPKLEWQPATKIGKMGNTGISTGAHLHIGVVHGVHTNLWRLSDMANGMPLPNRRETEFFIDKDLFRFTPHVTVGWLGYANHFAYDVVPLNRHQTTANFDIYWNRSFNGRVVKTGEDRAYGKYVIIWYDTNQHPEFWSQMIKY